MNILSPTGSLSKGFRPATSNDTATSAFHVRNADIAALRPDGSKIFGQRRIPALASFDDALAAFAQGSLFKSSDGFIAVEDIQPGDKLVSADGRIETVTWIGSALFTPEEMNDRVRLTRVMADSFGQNRPENITTLGPAARISQTPPDLRGATFSDRLMTPASRFLDGMNVIELTPPAPVRLFHIAMRKHMVILCNGLPVESYHPGQNSVSQMSETLRAAFCAMFPHVAELRDFGPMAFARAPEYQPD